MIMLQNFVTEMNIPAVPSYHDHDIRRHDYKGDIYRTAFDAAVNPAAGMTRVR